MTPDENDELRPWYVHFDEDAKDLMDAWRKQCSSWEDGTVGLLLSHIGKLPGLAARLSLVLAAIDHAFEDAPAPNTITANEFGRACHFIETYGLPMARRCYAPASMPAEENAARHLLGIIRSQRWTSFTTRQVMRLDRSTFSSRAKLDPALTVLIEGDCIRATNTPSDEPLSGRPVKAFTVNPAVFEVAS